jgi:hypothetical protein
MQHLTREQDQGGVEGDRTVQTSGMLIAILTAFVVVAVLENFQYCRKNVVQLLTIPIGL